MVDSRASTSASGTRGLWAAVGSATLVGGALRAWYVGLAHPPARYLYSDMLANVMRAYAVIDPRHVPGPWDTFVPRGIVELCALALRLFPNRSVEALTPLQALLSTACIPLVFVGLRRFFGPRPAAVAAWLLALDYLAIGYAGFYLAENYLLFFLAVSLALLSPDRPGRTFFAGLALGLAAWFKAQAFTLLPLWGFALWWAGRRAARDPRAGSGDPTWPDTPPRRLSALTLLLGCLVFVVPESVLVSRIAGRPIFMSSNGGQNFYSGHCPIHLATCTGSWGAYAGGLPKVYQRDEGWPDVTFSVPFYDSAFYLKQGLLCIRQSGWRLPIWLLQQIGDTFAGWPGSTIDVWPDWSTAQFPWARGTNLAIAYLIAPLAFLGLWRSRRRLGAWLAFGLPAISVLGVALLFLGDPRFRQPYDFFFFGAAASVLVEAWESATLRGRLARASRRTIRPLAALARFGRGLARGGVLPMLAAAAGVFMTWPLWRAPWFDSHEGPRYLQRLVELFRAWASGQIWPRWAPDFFGARGSPIFEFQPPGFLAPAALLHLAGLSVPASLVAASVAFAALGAAGAYRLAHGETGRGDAALVGALAFTLAPYRFVDLLMRGALSEFAAFALFPWALFFVRELSRCPRERRGGAAVRAALAAAAMILTDPLDGVVAIFLLAAFAAGPAFADWRAGRRRRALLPAASLLFALGLSAVALVPALADARLVHLARGMTGYFAAAAHLVPPGDFFHLGSYALVADVPAQGVRMPFSIGWPVGFGLLLLLAVLPSPRLRRRLAPAWPWWGACAALLLLMTPAATPLWRYVLPFAALQFPWRLLGFVAAAGAVAVGLTWAAVIGSAPLFASRVPLAALAAAFFLLEARPMEEVTSYRAPSAAELTPGAIARSLDDTGSAGEYLPAGAPSPLHPREMLAARGSAGVTADVRSEGPTRYRVAVSSATEGVGSLDLEVYDFPGWHLRTLSGPAPATARTSPVGLLRIDLPRQGRYELEVEYGTTPLRRVAGAVSLLSLLLLWPLSRLALGRRPALIPEAAALRAA